MLEETLRYLRIDRVRYAWSIRRRALGWIPGSPDQRLRPGLLVAERDIPASLTDTFIPPISA